MASVGKEAMSWWNKRADPAIDFGDGVGSGEKETAIHQQMSIVRQNLACQRKQKF